MAKIIEIERKFLTKQIPFSLDAFPSKELWQSYLSFSPTIRIRRSEDAYFLTVKGKGQMAREELELSIKGEEYARLREKTEGAEVRKRRYFVPLEEGLVAEVDIYFGELEGLVTTEVEFPSLEAAEAYVAPTWFGADVTGDWRYKNTALSQFGMPK